MRNMTKYSYATASALFEKYGYSETCEFVRISDSKRGKFLSRCKTCGYEFERDNNILRKPQKKLRCPKCHDQKITVTLEYYKAGHSRYECAEKFGLTPVQVQNYAKHRGVHGGMSKEKLGEFAKANQKKASERSAELSRERAEIRNNDKRILREFKSLRRDVDEWRKGIESLLEISERQSKVFNQLDEWANGEYSWYKDSLIAYEPKIAVCKRCGKEWLFWPSHEKYGRRNPSLFCSSKCLNRYYKTGTIGDRLRRYGRAEEQRDVIPLDEVIERDNGICYLCGCKTNKADSWHDANGYFVCGDTYPTRDHVIPIAKGGTHTWSNVRLACHKCNSVKNDRLLEEIML